MVNQIKVEYIVKGEKNEEIYSWSRGFDQWNQGLWNSCNGIVEENGEANAFSNYALGQPLSKKVHYTEWGNCYFIEDEITPTWMTPLYRFIQRKEVPDDEVEAAKIRRVATNYLIIEGPLYKKGHLTTYLRCVATQDTECILKELHKSYIASHEGVKSIIRKALRQGYC